MITLRRSSFGTYTQQNPTTFWILRDWNHNMRDWNHKKVTNATTYKPFQRKGHAGF